MQNIIQIIQIVVAILLITVILLQSRGAEKILFIATIILAVIFLGTALVNILI